MCVKHPCEWITDFHTRNAKNFELFEHPVAVKRIYVNKTKVIRMR